MAKKEHPSMAKLSLEVMQEVVKLTDVPMRDSRGQERARKIVEFYLDQSLESPSLAGVVVARKVLEAKSAFRLGVLDLADSVIQAFLKDCGDNLPEKYALKEHKNEKAKPSDVIKV